MLIKIRNKIILNIFILIIIFNLVYLLLPLDVVAISNPTEISGCEVWFDADDINSITKDASNLISQWNDKSGNNRHATQAILGDRPTYLPNTLNSKAVINFEGNSLLGFAGSFMGNDNSYSIVVLEGLPNMNFGSEINYYPFISADHDKFTIGYDSSRLGNFSLMMRNSSNLLLKMGHDEQYIGGPTYNVWIISVDSTNGVKIYKNCRFKNSADFVAGIGDISTVNIGAGYKPDGTRAFFNGYIAEVVIYNKPLDENDRELVSIYLGDKWNVFVDPDTDNDGIADSEDAYPTDAAKASIAFYPSNLSIGNLIFEDNWPAKGDYDLNDLVLAYKFANVTNADNEILEIHALFTVRAIGAFYHNGFGIQFPDLAISDIANATLSINNQTANTILYESGQSKPVFIIFNDVFDYMQNPNGPATKAGNFVNTESANSDDVADLATFELIITLNTPKTSVGTPPYNPFLIINENRHMEVHLPGYPPTDVAWNPVQASQGDNREGDVWDYKTGIGGYPWAMDMPANFDYPLESQEITHAYPGLIEWANSGGTSNTDWYYNTSKMNTEYMSQRKDAQFDYLKNKYDENFKSRWGFE